MGKKAVMPKGLAESQELVERLNHLLAEAHSQAPAKTRRQIEEGYGDVVLALVRLLAAAGPPEGLKTVWRASRPPTAADQPLGTCTITVPPDPTNPGSLPMTYTKITTRTDCELVYHGSWHPKHTMPPPAKE
jgi:hypothetical protein